MTQIQLNLPRRPHHTLTELWVDTHTDSRAHGFVQQALFALLMATPSPAAVITAPNEEAIHLLQTKADDANTSPVHGLDWIERMSDEPDVFLLDEDCEFTQTLQGDPVTLQAYRLIRSPFQLLSTDETKLLVGNGTMVTLYHYQPVPIWPNWTPKPTIALPDAPPNAAQHVAMAPSLSKRVNALAQSTLPFDRVCSVGTTLRGHRPQSREERSAMLQGQTIPPFDACKAWIRALTTDQLVGIHYEAQVNVQSLEYRLQSLFNQLRDSDRPAELVQHIVFTRDQLEDALTVLAHAGRTDTLVLSLDALDALAARHIDLLYSAGFTAPEWLARTTFSEPDAWWATL